MSTILTALFAIASPSRVADTTGTVASALGSRRGERRPARGELASLDDHLLRDIGLHRGQTLAGARGLALDRIRGRLDE